MFQAIVNPRESAVGATRHTFPPPWGVHQDCPVLAAWKRSSNYKVITEEFGVPWAIAILRDFEGTIRSWLVELKTKTNVSGWSFQMDVDDHEPSQATPNDARKPLLQWWVRRKRSVMNNKTKLPYWRHARR